MRRLGKVAGAVAVVVGVGGAAAMGCVFSTDYEDCSVYPHAGCGDGGGGAGGGTPAGCVPSENADAVGDTCGVFVSAGGDDAAAGTKMAPMQTLGAAIARVMEGGGRVYACAETFAGAVEVPAGVTIYGGLDCANGWGWVGEAQKTIVEGAADEIALRVSGGEGAARLEDVAVRAADAVVAGGSSIAVMIDGATAELVRCELTAGNGAEGAEGTPGAAPDGMGQIPAAAAGMAGNPGVNACSDLDMSGMPDPALVGGAPATNDCGGGQQSIGGGGGTGNIANGGPGGPGETGTLGAAGAGEPGMGAWSCAVEGEGQGGSDGMAGMPGMGAAGSGTLSSTGYAGLSGGPGTPGQPGQGGGGGGGAKGGNAICPGMVAGAGASGGSGGAGGCGGQPGQGGGPGGASIALASVNAQVTLTGCRLTAGNGGRGGAGGDFQPGGLGGQGGIGGAGVGGSKAACAGGQGGQGGNGGPGGGGLGGPSAVIAHVGTAVVKDAATTLTPGTAGDGGPGGNADLAMNSGAAGAAAEELELP